MFVASGKEEEIYFSGYLFKYILKPRVYDTDHLIVVFSGFGANSDFTYDFRRALQESCRAAVLWIKDDFYSNQFATYYLDPLDEIGLETAMINFITEVQSFLKISVNRTTLLGCSKGGASALYYGIKYNFSNIVVSAPTILIGSSIAGIAPKGVVRASAAFICGGEVNKNSIDLLDNKILSLINKDENYQKNIFLISSEADPRHQMQVKPFVGVFNKYNNFNYIESRSVLVRSHQDVTSYNAPLIMSILNCFSFNMITSFINSITMGDNIDKTAEVTKKVVFDVKKIEFDAASKFHPEGVFFLRGLECKNYTDLKYLLYLESESNIVKIDLAKGNKKSITKEYYQDTYVNYDKSYFCTPKYQGISLDDIQPGLYQMFVEITMQTGDKKKVNLKYKMNHSVISNNGRYEVFSKADNHLVLKVT